MFTIAFSLEGFLFLNIINIFIVFVFFRKTLELEDSSSIQRSIIVNQSSANSLTTPPAAVFLPNIHSSHYEQNHDHKFVSSQKQKQ
jgi:hypothetical protein